MAVLALILLQSAAEEPVRSQRPVPKRHTSIAFQRALTRNKLTFTRQDVPLRSVLRDISKSAKIAILLDRRIDPTHHLKLTVKRTSVLDTLQLIAKQVSAQTAVVGNVVYIGSQQRAAALNAAVKARSADLRKQTRALPIRERLRFSRRRTLHWNDLDRPRDLVRTFAGQWNFQVDGLEKIPHDLWAGCTLPSVSSLQGLSLILVQFDLTFRWKPGLKAIVIVPLAKAPDTK
ncbi:MAG: hypothetical protein ACE5KM_18835 [Planctomycetaceae bacterium]